MLGEVGSMSKNILGDDSGSVRRNIRDGSRKGWRQKDVFKVKNNEFEIKFNLNN